MSSERSREIGREQKYISMLYGRLDDLREKASARLARVFQEAGTNRQAQSQRDAAAAMYTERLTRLNAAENGLCFGRLDFDDDERRYIGRLGILDDSADYEPLLLDWRAPAARPFYLATALSPQGVRLRRHIRTTGRAVAGIEDEVLDLNAAERPRHEGLTSEAALLAALNTGRTGRMGDIVETIQAEQDRVIRSDHKGVLVVQGGPGTGKTVVALHRAAYLLYTYRELLSRRGVLIVGPNTTFLRYIGEVLPSLGETGVLLSTIGELYPGISARRWEAPAAAAIKGRPAMADVVAAAVRDRQWVPDDALEVTYEREVFRLDRVTCLRIRDRARGSRLPHNQARQVVAREVIDELAGQVADRLGGDPYAGDPLSGDDAPGEGANLLDDVDVDDIRRELRENTEVWAAVDRLWPILTPRRLLADLFSSADRLSSAAPDLAEAERAPLLRDPEGGWTPADVPLLDEAAELLGEDDRAARAFAERRRREDVAYAQELLDITYGSRSTDLEDDPEILTATDLVDAERLAERHEDVDTRTTAERAAADRRWTFGHVIVDEAQELSAMAWRMVMRRCPTRSMTLVGDVAQTGELAGTSSWRRVLDPYVADRWRLARLTINYRTPAEIMAVAADVLARVDVGLEPPESVRETGVEPWRLEVPAADIACRLAAVAAREAAEVGNGRLGVIVPTTRRDELGDDVKRAVPDTAFGDDPDLESRVTVLSVKQAKGLEFDSVLVADPARILAESPRGHSDLYVALTRTTQRLGVVHTGEPPAELARLCPREDPIATR
ncbi:MAG: HelD family protein [Streptosporangiaceae bacterium]